MASIVRTRFTLIMLKSPFDAPRPAPVSRLMWVMARMIHCAAEPTGGPMEYTRREVGKLVLAVPAASLLPRDLFAQAKPNSKWAGVQVGLNVPYNFGSRT